MDVDVLEALPATGAWLQLTAMPTAPATATRFYALVLGPSPLGVQVVRMGGRPSRPQLHNHTRPTTN